MNVGFFARGSNDHLVIDDQNPVLCQVYSGRIVVNTLPPRSFFAEYTDEYGNVYGQPRTPAYGYCEVTYPAPIHTAMPPMVFAVPSGAGSQGLGLFCHRGGAGRWTGFSVLVTRDIFLGNSTPMLRGFDSGWQYRVCTFGDPGRTRDGAKSEMGLRILGENGVPIFDSNWPFVPFRGLLSGWTFSDMTRSYGVWAHWGFRVQTNLFDEDFALVKGYHGWGVADGAMGFLLSGLGLTPVRQDFGTYDITPAAVVLMGFAGGNRSNIWAVAVAGMSQHPAGDISIMREWNLLTADFTHV